MLEPEETQANHPMSSSESASCQWNIYRGALAPYHLGDALWEPGPIPSYKRVRIGDVGYIRKGRFHLLFSAGIPLGSRTLGTDVPRTFEHLNVGLILQGDARPPGHLRTDSVREIGGTVGGSGAVACAVEPGANFTFELSQKQGAVLITKHPTYSERAERIGAFKRYTKAHYDSWVEFALENDHGEDVRPVLVDGVHLTREFAMFAYSDNRTRIRCEFSADVPAVASASVSLWGSWRTEGLVHTNCGPHPVTTAGNRSLIESPAPESAIPDECNQCVFVSYYTVRKILGFPRVIKAGAGPHHLPEGNPGHDDTGEVAMVEDSGSDPMDVDYPETGSPLDVIHNIPLDERDGFDVVAEFIFQRSNATSILLHHRDIQGLLQVDEEETIRLLEESRVVERVEIDENGVGQLIQVSRVESKLPDLREEDSNIIDDTRVRTHLTQTRPLTARRPLAKKQRFTYDTKLPFDITKESADWFSPLESALGVVNVLIKHYEEYKDVEEKIKALKPQLNGFNKAITTTTVDRDPEETRRRTELTGVLEEIERRSRELLAKTTATRFVDKAGYLGEVVRLIERLGETITHYQISQQQAIYDQIINITSSFDTLLKLHEKSSAVKDKLDSVMTRLSAQLCSEDDGGGPWDENRCDQRAKLFDTLRLIEVEGNALWDRINAQGHEECQGDIQAVSEIAEDIRDALLDYQVCQQWAIYDQNCRLIDAEDLSVLKNCRRAQGAGYQRGDRKGCLRGTRETVLNEIELWANDINQPPIFWLNGLAGTGKSTIAQTVSERIFADGLLGASFFCSRNFKHCSNIHFIFPTLAFQLAQKYPDFRSLLVRLLRSKPEIVHGSLYSQMQKLIVKPLQSAGVSTVILIDALDECTDDEPQSIILSILGRLAEEIPKVKFFITGRPELRIRSGFRLPLLKALTNVFTLHDIQPDSTNNDIKLFLQHELSELARQHLLERWPTDEAIDILCLRAGGRFVYAAATAKYLNKTLYLPNQQLEKIINSPHTTDYEGNTSLDSLYLLILEEAPHAEDPIICSKVRSVIGTVALVANPLPPSGIAELVGLETREVLPFLTSVQSLLVLDEDPTEPVKLFHKTFPDFITDPSRCADTRFYVSPEDLHLELTTNCLRLMNEGLEQDLLSLPAYSLNSEVEDLETRIENRISVGLRYACQSWHHHLTAVQGDVADIVSRLRFFLEQKFLAWLEVVSVLGATRGAVIALENLVSWSQKVAKDEQLLCTARDYFHFVTSFFEPISVSAVHIYHSALELSPELSTVRRLYHDRRPTPLPRVAAGIADSWDSSIDIPKLSNFCHPIWSPCGRFVAIQAEGAVEIRDSLTAELLSTPEPSGRTPRLIGAHAYSPDGRSLACASDTAIVIWDIQTGGVAKKIQLDASFNTLPVWSLDGETICAMTRREQGGFTVQRFDVISGAAQSAIRSYSLFRPHLWAHDKSFRVMATGRHAEADPAWNRTIDIFEVGPTLTKIESFDVRDIGGEASWEITSFSPTTYRISVSMPSQGRLLVLDIRSSGRLLDETQKHSFEPHCFSPDGGFFAATQNSTVQIWKHDGSSYVAWRKLPTPQHSHSYLLFSPTSSSVLGVFKDILKVWHLDDLFSPSTPHGRPFCTFPRSGAYLVTTGGQGNTVTITDVLSRTPLQLIDTGIEIYGLGLTGNVLLVEGSKAVVAWLLTEEGLVNGVFGDRIAGRGDSIWTVPMPNSFSAKGETVVIRSGDTPHAYNTRTGETLNVSQTAPDWSNWRSCSLDVIQSRLYGGSIDDALLQNVEKGWVEDRGGRHLLWLPIGWRNMDTLEMGWWFSDAAIIQFRAPSSETVTIKLY